MLDVVLVDAKVNHRNVMVNGRHYIDLRYWLVILMHQEIYWSG